MVFRLPLATEIGRISTNVSLATLILEIDLCLIQWCAEQIIGLQFDAGARRGADAQSVQSQRVATGDPILLIKRQKLG